jgi:uncharacterized protein
MNTFHFFIFLLLTFIAEVIGTLGGFGSSVFFVPFANFFFAFHTVLGLTAVFHLSSNISKIVLFRKGLDKTMLLRIGIPSVIFVIIGGMASKLFAGQILEVTLGVFLILTSIIFLIKENLSIPTTFRASVIGGAVSGFSAGMLGTGGAIRGLTMAAFNLEKSVFIATSAAIDFSIDFTRTFVYFFNGYITRDLLIYVPFLFLIGFAGTYLGRYILQFIPQEKFKILSLILVLLIGILSISKHIIPMLKESVL